jgi:hypothetical protein
MNSVIEPCNTSLFDILKMQSQNVNQQILQINYTINAPSGSKTKFSNREENNNHNEINEWLSDDNVDAFVTKYKELYEKTIGNVLTPIYEVKEETIEPFLLDFSNFTHVIDSAQIATSSKQQPKEKKNKETIDAPSGSKKKFSNREKKRGRPSVLDSIKCKKLKKKIANVKCARKYREKKLKVIKKLESEVFKKYKYLPTNILKNCNNLESIKREFGEEKTLKMQEEMDKVEEEYMSKTDINKLEGKEKKQFVNQISSAKYRVKKRYYIEHLVNLLN